jgi:type II secretory pathway component PulK
LNRKGFALLTVLFLAAIVASGAYLAWSMASTDMQISSNVRKISLAKSAAHAGIEHFISLGLTDHDIRDRFFISETSLSSNTSYEVVASWLDQQRLLVVSTGKYKKNGKTLFSYPVRAVFGS